MTREEWRGEENPLSVLALENDEDYLEGGRDGARWRGLREKNTMREPGPK